MGIITKILVKKQINLVGKTARVRFMKLRSGKIGFFTESYKTGQSVSIAFSKEDIDEIKKFFAEV